MVDKNIVIEHYGIDPPETAKPFWEDNNIPDEDKTIFNLDLQESLQKLTYTERKIVLLSNQGYSIREIEEMIGLPSTTVHRTKDRALKKLKRMMDGVESTGEIWK